MLLYKEREIPMTTVTREPGGGLTPDYSVNPGPVDYEYYGNLAQVPSMIYPPGASCVLL